MPGASLTAFGGGPSRRALTPRDRHRARPLGGGPGRGQACGGDRAAQPRPAAAPSSRGRRRHHPEEHPHDRPHRRGQDRDRPAPRPAVRQPLHQGGGLEVHRGGLRRPRRGVHRPGPRGVGGGHGPSGEAGGGPGEGGSPGRGAPPRPPPAAPVRPRSRRRQRRRRSRRLLPPRLLRRHPREAACTAPRGRARGPHRRGRGPRADDAHLPDPGQPGRRRRWTSNFRDLLPGLFGNRTKRRSLPVSEAREILHAGGGREPRGPGAGGPRGRGAGRVLGDRLPRRDGQDRRAREPPTAPTSRGRACSAISCPSSRARRSPPSTARSAPTTSSSSPPGPFTSASPPT